MDRRWMLMFLIGSVISSPSSFAIDVTEIMGSWRHIGGRCTGGPLEPVVVPEVLKISATLVEYKSQLQFQFPACGEIESFSGDQVDFGAIEFRLVDNSLELSEKTPWQSTFCTFPDPDDAQTPTVIHHRVSHLDKTWRRYKLESLNGRQILVEEIPDMSCPTSGRYQYLFEMIQPAVM